MVCDIIGFFFIIKFGNRYVFIFIEYFIKWVEGFFLFLIEVVRICCIFVEEIFICYGVLCIFLFDCGSNFLLLLVKEVCWLFNIIKFNIIVYYFVCDG